MDTSVKPIREQKADIMNHTWSCAVSRREFLSAVGAVGITLGLGLPSVGKGAEAAKIPIGLELYSLREECKTDLPGMLSAVAKIGYKGVEFAGYHGRSAKELRKMLDDNGIVACGTHTPYESVLGDKLKETIEFNQTIGNKFLIVPWMTAKTKEEWLDKAKLFNELADKVKHENMWIGYHSHAHDFQKVDGVESWEIFGRNTKPEVILQLDVSNCADGGGDPVAELKKFIGRTRSIHIKPHGAGPEAVIGEDKLNWNAIFYLCETKGRTQWYVVEHETSKNPLETVRRTYAALQKLGKV
jgi:sugar phosphate isomerase/epimerase